MLIKFIQTFLLFYTGVLVALYYFQRNLIYFPDTNAPQLIAGVEVVDVTTSDNLKLRAWYIPPSDNKLVIVFFHGNAGHYGYRVSKIPAYLQAGYGVLLAEYRGYGGNPGKISEEGFYRDARAYMAWIGKEKGIPPERLVLYGESIGSGPAVQMATEYDIAALILETPFASLSQVAQKHYFYVPVKYMLKDTYQNIEKIGGVHVPLLVLHGHKDTIIPFSQGQNLYEAAHEPKMFIDFPQGNHNDLYEWGMDRHVLEFLGSLEGQEQDKIERR